jgi:ProP effector
MSKEPLVDTQDQEKAELAEAKAAAEGASKASESEAGKPAAGAKAEASQEGSHFEHVKESLDILCERFPKAFIKEGDCVPLKIGIFNDLRKACEGVEGLSVSKIRAAVRFYTSRLRYLYCLKEGAKRVGIDGEEAGEVSKEHAEFAQAKFKEINGARKKKSGARKGGKGRRPQIQKPALSDLKKGVEVRVMTSDRRSVAGTVSEDAESDRVSVTLNTGMTISVSPDRLFIAQGRKKAQQ